MQIAIVDDLAQDRSDLSTLLEQWSRRSGEPIELHTFSNGEAFMKNYVPGSYDVIFLDIYMKGADGFAIASALPTDDERRRVIFLSSRPDCGEQTYHAGAAYYLIKPVTAERLDLAMQTTVSRRQQEEKCVEILSDRLKRNVPLTSILYVDVEGNGIRLHTDAGVFKVYQSFSSFAPSLLSDDRFLQCYQGCIVNMDRIQEPRSKDFFMDNKESVPIRKKHAGEIHNAYTAYLFRRLRSRPSPGSSASEKAGKEIASSANK